MGRTSDARERLLDTAQKLVWEHSYGAVGVEAICQAAEVNKGSFYHFFSSKEELVAEALAAYQEAGKAKLDETFSAGLPPIERLWRWFDAIEAQQVAMHEKTGHTLGCPIGTVGVELATRCPDLAHRVKELLARQVRYVESAVRDAQAEGTVRPDVSARALADALFAQVTGVMVQARIRNDPRIGPRLAEGAKLLLGVPETAIPR